MEKIYIDWFGDFIHDGDLVTDLEKFILTVFSLGKKVEIIDLRKTA